MQNVFNYFVFISRIVALITCGYITIDTTIILEKAGWVLTNVAKSDAYLICDYLLIAVALFFLFVIITVADKMLND